MLMSIILLEKMNKEKKAQIKACIDDKVKKEIEISIEGQVRHACPIVGERDYCMYINKDVTHQIEEDFLQYHYDCLKIFTRDTYGRD